MTPTHLPARLRHALATLLSLAATPGCGDDSAEGDLVVTAYGESFIEEGIPADEMADGWSVRFDRFEVDLEQVYVAGAEVEVDATVELTTPSGGSGHTVGSAFVPAGSYAEPTFTIARVGVSGSAEKGAESREFDWTFERPTPYESCDTTTVVSAEEPATFEITVHADHLFYDSLVAEEPELRFQALADADEDEDGVISREELEAADLGAYDPGSGGDIDDLWGFLEAQVRTLGHVDGEGHCHVHDD